MLEFFKIEGVSVEKIFLNNYKLKQHVNIYWNKLFSSNTYC